LKAARRRDKSERVIDPFGRQTARRVRLLAFTATGSRAPDLSRLYALQHRGQESCGMSPPTAERLVAERAMGYVSEASIQPTLDRLTGPRDWHCSLFHAGEVSVRECQPFLVTCQHGQIAVCHNGNLPFAGEERKRLEKEGAIFRRRPIPK